ncbi:MULTISPECIES: peptidylprolyl isomerase [unclassified Enterococcus]|uniref:peptidylprolyl isomerase n=1 Tax=unclassified Enterococcus TaxID=2608891 RepID=UPI001557FF32|nr:MULTISPECIES: peptidylprolyl isomerase [unclassified Enterococcus]MBS7576564.1 peptidylprolyl isomerase [Enterococcus sp. MMGLQ5-2]MBS7583949.1 peptidylprolyl isomerase [Enterococcus sp. MMGLQ5-1]NPD11810.1 hypothetical protein [Enterococcus sp. MMGLQ5-1]NPD36401.1 hypothetical protein [Enterococcus sp. MMGLQ5-2]
MKKYFNTRKKRLITISTLMLILITGVVVIMLIFGGSPTVYQIDEDQYSLKDFNFQRYLARSEVVNKTTNLSIAELEARPDGQTSVRILIEDKIEQNLKVQTAVRLLASKYKIILTEGDKKSAIMNRDAFIKQVGGNTKYKKFLKDNETDNQTLTQYYQSDILYQKIKEKVFSAGKTADLSEAELADAAKSYPKNIAKISYILFKLTDDSGEALSASELEAKSVLAEELASQLTIENFQTLAKEKTEDYENAGNPIYLENAGSSDTLSQAVFATEPNQISSPITLGSGIVIINRLTLDEAYYQTYLETLRQKKLTDEMKAIVDTLNVHHGKGYRKIEVK